MVGKARVEIELFREIAELLTLRRKLPCECRAPGSFLRQTHYYAGHLRLGWRVCRLQQLRSQSLISVALGQALASLVPRGGGFLRPARKIPCEADNQMAFAAGVEEILGNRHLERFVHLSFFQRHLEREEGRSEERRVGKECR